MPKIVGLKEDGGLLAFIISTLVVGHNEGAAGLQISYHCSTFSSLFSPCKSHDNAKKLLISNNNT